MRRDARDRRRDGWDRRRDGRDRRRAVRADVEDLACGCVLRHMPVPPATKVVNPYLFCLPMPIAEAEPRILIFHGGTEILLPFQSQIHVVFEGSTLTLLEDSIPVHHGVAAKFFLDLLRNRMTKFIFHKEREGQRVGFIGYDPVMKWLPHTLLPEAGMIVFFFGVEGGGRPFWLLRFRIVSHKIIYHLVYLVLQLLDPFSEGLEEAVVSSPSGFVSNEYIKMNMICTRGTPDGLLRAQGLVSGFYFWRTASLLLYSRGSFRHQISR